MSIPGPSQDAETRVAAVRHYYRNRIQTMTSLVGLYGREMPAGDCRRGFEDMRARFEAVAAEAEDQGGEHVVLDLEALVRRIASILDPRSLRQLKIAGGLATVSRARSGPLSQLVAELMIQLYRDGLEGAGRGVAEVEIDPGEAGALRLRAADATPRKAAAAARPERADASFGVTMAQSLAAAAGGSLTRGDDPLTLELVVPPEARQS